MCLSLAFEVMGVLHLNIFIQARIWDRASLRKFTSETLHTVADMAGKVSRWLVLVDIIVYGTRVAKEYSDS
jgi:hypothetical protein